MDFSEIAAIVAIIGAVVSPAATTYLNNKHAERMKQLEYKHQEHEDQVRREREIYEGYIRAAGAAIQSASPENLREYGSHSALVAYYVPKDVRNDILQLDKQMKYTGIYDDKLEAKIDLLSKIVTELRDLK